MPWRGASATGRSTAISRRESSPWWTAPCRPRSSGHSIAGRCSKPFNRSGTAVNSRRKPPWPWLRGPQDNAQPAPVALPLIPPDDDDDADRPGSSSLLGSDDAVAPGPGGPAKRRDDNKLDGRADRKDLPTIEAILDSPKTFEDMTLTLDGLYKVGTKVTLLKGPDKNTVGWSLPVGGDDDRLICTGDAKAVGRDRYLVLDSGLAPLLLNVFDQLKFRPAARPTYKCTLTVTVRQVIVNGARVPAVEIAGLEILGICDFVKVAQRRYDKAFLTVRVTPERAWVAYGDGPLWVERLGGEERFIKPLRRKLRRVAKASHRRARCCGRWQCAPGRARQGREHGRGQPTAARSLHGGFPRRQVGLRGSRTP